MNTDHLILIYEQLKDRYPLIRTNAFALDDGFTEDMPVLVGRNNDAECWLYEWGGDFVFSVEIPGMPYRDHRHPQSIDEAVLAVIGFMEQK